MTDVVIVWHGSQEKYQRFPEIGGRFNSEFGMAALPAMATIKSFVKDENELYAQSRTMDFHNKADGHERRIATYVLENFRNASDLPVSRMNVLTDHAQLTHFRPGSTSHSSCSQRPCSMHTEIGEDSGAIRADVAVHLCGSSTTAGHALHGQSSTIITAQSPRITQLSAY